MSKPKKLNKKIRRLEGRIQKDMKKLSALRQRAAAAAEGGKTKGKSAGRAKLIPKTAKPSARKSKRKSGLTPEGRAKLAAIMKARWAAKRAAAATPASTH
jgi:hypothetical protein